MQLTNFLVLPNFQLPLCIILYLLSFGRGRGQINHLRKLYFPCFQIRCSQNGYSAVIFELQSLETEYK